MNYHEILILYEGSLLHALCWIFWTHVYPLELQTTTRAEKITSRGPSAVLTLSPRKFLTRRSSLWLFPAPPHKREHCKREPTTRPQTCLTTKNLNKRSIDKLCLMTAPRPIKSGQKQIKTTCTHKTLDAYF